MSAVEHKSFLITGGSSGIGKATALTLAGENVSLALAGRDKDRLYAVRKECENLGSQVIAIQTDLCFRSSATILVQNAVEQLGKLDGLVHSAGVRFLEPLRAYKQETNAATWEVNVRVAFDLVAAFRKPTIRKKQSSIVMVSSVMGQTGQPAVSSYCASKGAIEAAVRAWAVELAREGVRVNTVVPGYLEGGMFDEHAKILAPEQIQKIRDRHPLGIGKSVYVANVIDFLLSSKSQWVTGASIPVDGGYLAC